MIVLVLCLRLDSNQHIHRKPPPQDGVSTNFTTQAKTVSDTDLMDSDLAGIRTQDPYIKSVLLYQLSYQVGHFPNRISSVFKSGAKIKIFLVSQNFLGNLYKQDK